MHFMQMSWYDVCMIELDGNLKRIQLAISANAGKINITPFFVDMDGWYNVTKF